MTSLIGSRVGPKTRVQISPFNHSIYFKIRLLCALLKSWEPATHHITVPNLVSPPPGFPSALIRMHGREAEIVARAVNVEFGLGGLTLAERLAKSFLECDAVAVKSCKEMEGAYCEYAEKVFGKPVLLAGPMVPKTPSSKLDERFDGWLKRFGSASVIYYALGSECTLEMNQFQELLLGLELTGTYTQRANFTVQIIFRDLIVRCVELVL